MLLAYIFPIISIKYFPTLDGPAHLYNAKVFNELVSNSDSFYHSFYEINRKIPPNITGHLILSVLLLILPVWLAEKIILLIYAIGLPVGLRYLFKSYDFKGNIILYLIFPFIYSFLFYYGSYNFNIAIVLSLFAIAYLKKIEPNNTKKYIIFSIIFGSLIVITHIFVYVIFAMFFLVDIINRVILLKTKITFKNILFLCLTQLPPIIFIISYFSASPAVEAQSTYLGFHEIITRLYRITPLISINFGRAELLSKLVFIIFVANILYLIIQKILRKLNQESNRKGNNVWLIFTLLLLVLIFFVPDSKGKETGFIIERISILFFISLIIFLSSFEYRKWFNISIIILISISNIFFLSHHINASRRISQDTESLVEISNLIDENAIVYPIVVTDHFIYQHMSNYLAAEKNILITDNYEADLGDFLIIWNKNKIPHIKLGNKSIGNYQPKQSINKNCVDVDFILILSNSPISDYREVIKAEIYKELSDYSTLKQSENKNIILLKRIE